MLSNQDIVEKVFLYYEVRSQIKKMIQSSIIDDSCKDLEQYVYIQLLKMDNEKLNMLYERGKDLKKWISAIIRNSRNHTQREYQKSRLIDHISLDDNMCIDWEHNYYLDFLDVILERYNWEDLKTKDEINMAANFEILKFYLSSGYSMAKISKLFNCSPTKINNMLISAKEDIKRTFELKYDTWLDKNNINI